MQSIKEAWNSYEQQVIPKGAKHEFREAVKYAFYIGATHSLKEVMNNPEEAFRELSKELVDFRSECIAKAAKE